MFNVYYKLNNGYYNLYVVINNNYYAVRLAFMSDFKAIKAYIDSGVIKPLEMFLEERGKNS